jgi:hypothetical protein
VSFCPPAILSTNSFFRQFNFTFLPNTVK